MNLPAFGIILSCFSITQNVTLYSLGIFVLVLCLMEYIISVYYQHRITLQHDLILSETINVPSLTFILTEICDLPFNGERCLDR